MSILTLCESKLCRSLKDLCNYDVDSIKRHLEAIELIKNADDSDINAMCDKSLNSCKNHKCIDGATILTFLILSNHECSKDKCVNGYFEIEIYKLLIERMKDHTIQSFVCRDTFIPSTANIDYNAHRFLGLMGKAETNLQLALKYENPEVAKLLIEKISSSFLYNNELLVDKTRKALNLAREKTKKYEEIAKLIEEKLKQTENKR